MASTAVTPDEIREGLSAFFADVDPASLTSDEIKPEELSTASEFNSARQLDASDFIIDSMDVVDDVPARENSTAVSDADGLDASTVADISLDELQLVEPLTADTDLIDADYVSSLEDVFVESAGQESSAEQVDADEDGLSGQLDSDYASSLEDVVDEVADQESAAEQADSDRDELDGQLDSMAVQVDADEDELSGQHDSALENIADAETVIAAAEEEVDGIKTSGEAALVEASDHEFSVDNSVAAESDAVSGIDTSLDELQLVEPMAAESDLIDANPLSPLGNVVDEVADQESLAEQADSDEDELDGQLDSDYVSSLEDVVDDDMSAQESSSENANATEITAASITVSARDVLQPTEPLADESELFDADYTASLEDVVDEVSIHESSAESTDSDDKQAHAESTSDGVAPTGEADWHTVDSEGGDSKNAYDNDASVEDLNLRDVVMKEGVDIDLFADDADSSDSSDSTDAFDSTVDEQTLDGQDFVGAQATATGQDQSIQVIVGESQQVPGSALVAQQKSVELADYYPAVDSLDSTQSDFDLDIPNAPAPGGFIRRWYIRGAAFLKRMWRRIRRSKTDAQA